MADEARGTCALCQDGNTRDGMAEHLLGCRATAATRSRGKAVDLVQIAVRGAWDDRYWLYLELPATAKLTLLDSFLRELWLECCGHLSAFTIAGVAYMRPEGAMAGDQNMNVGLDRVLQVGAELKYEYDFGTTTELALRVVSRYQQPALGKGVVLLARNEPPDIPCAGCGRPAVWVCAYCAYEPDGWLCADCAAAHACGDEAMLPVVNSPRTGMCGYTGD